MTLLEFYRLCRAADWDYRYGEGEAFRKGEAEIASLRAVAKKSSRHQWIFDMVELARRSSSMIPTFEALTEEIRVAHRALTEAGYMPLSEYVALYGEDSAPTAAPGIDPSALDLAIAYHDERAQAAFEDAHSSTRPKSNPKKAADAVAIYHLHLRHANNLKAFRASLANRQLLQDQTP